MTLLLRFDTRECLCLTTTNTVPHISITGFRRATRERALQAKVLKHIPVHCYVPLESTTISRTCLPQHVPQQDQIRFEYGSSWRIQIRQDCASTRDFLRNFGRASWGRNGLLPTRTCCRALWLGRLPYRDCSALLFFSLSMNGLRRRPFLVVGWCPPSPFLRRITLCNTSRVWPSRTRMLAIVQ